MKTCPFCAEQIQDAAIVCKHCQRDLPVEGAQEIIRPSAAAPVVVAGKKHGTATALGGLFLVLLFVGFCAARFTNPSTSPSPPAASTNVGPSSGNPAHDRLMAATPEDRALMLSGGPGSDCPKAIRAFFAGMTADKTAMWNVRCSGGKSFQISVSPNPTGSTQIVDCDVLRTVNVECFRKLEDQR